MTYVNHKQTWTITDRNGNEIATKTCEGWEDNSFPMELIGEEQNLWEDEDGEGNIEFEPAETITFSALLHQETQEITCNEKVIGQLVYRRECEWETELDKQNKVCAAIEAIFRHETTNSDDASDILNAERKLSEELGEMRDSGNQYAYDNLGELLEMSDKTEEELRNYYGEYGTLF